MQTIVKKLNRENLDESAIVQAGELLKKGGLVAFPTETVYGLGGSALLEDAAKKIYAAKGRPADNPLIVHIADLQSLSVIVDHIPEQAWRLAEAFWPGPLTMVLPRTTLVPDSITGGLDTVAVRMPKDVVAQKLIQAGGGFVAAPSANVSGRPSPTMAKHVIEDLSGKVDMILDGDAADIGLESTIIDLTERPPRLLRPGSITVSMLEAVLGEVAYDAEKAEIDAKVVKAPGMKYRHYAPKAQLVIVEGTSQEVLRGIQSLIEKNNQAGIATGVIASEETYSQYRDALVKNIGRRGDEEQIAHNLYRILREFDETDVAMIYSESFALQDMEAAIMNRLYKAANYTVCQAVDL